MQDCKIKDGRWPWDRAGPERERWGGVLCGPLQSVFRGRLFSLEQGGGDLRHSLERELALVQKKEKKEKKKRNEEAPRKRKNRSRSPSRRKKKKKDQVEVVSRDGILSTLQTQLLQRAADTARQKIYKAKEEKKKHRRQSTGHQLARILTKLTSGGKDPGRRGDLRVQNEDKKEASRKKRRRKKKGGGDPDESPSGNSSGMSSYDSDWEETSTSSADRKMEAHP